MEQAGGGGRAAHHGNEVVLEGQDEGCAVHAGQQREGEPQQDPLDLLLPHAGSLPVLQAQLRRPPDGQCMHLQPHQDQPSWLLSTKGQRY